MADLGTIAMIARDEFLRRQTKARALVKGGQLTGERAEAEMRPWAAIAVLCSAPGVFDEVVASYRHAQRLYPAPARDILLPEAEARCDFARDLCGPGTWGPALSRARDAAIAKATTPETIARARDLCALAHALEIPLTPASSIRPAAATERKAA